MITAEHGSVTVIRITARALLAPALLDGCLSLSTASPSIPAWSVRPANWCALTARSFSRSPSPTATRITSAGAGGSRAHFPGVPVAKTGNAPAGHRGSVAAAQQRYRQLLWGVPSPTDAIA